MIRTKKLTNVGCLGQIFCMCVIPPVSCMELGVWHAEFQSILLIYRISVMWYMAMYITSQLPFHVYITTCHWHVLPWAHDIRKQWCYCIFIIACQSVCFSIVFSIVFRFHMRACVSVCATFSSRVYFVFFRVYACVICKFHLSSVCACVCFNRVQ